MSRGCLQAGQGTASQPRTAGTARKTRSRASPMNRGRESVRDGGRGQGTRVTGPRGLPPGLHGVGGASARAPDARALSAPPPWTELTSRPAAGVAAAARCCFLRGRRRAQGYLRPRPPRGPASPCPAGPPRAHSPPRPWEPLRGRLLIAGRSARPGLVSAAFPGPLSTGGEAE